MLRFYLLADEAPNPQPTALERLPPAGELTEDSFAQLQHQRLVEGRLDYHTGFRWSSSAVQAKLQLLLQQFPQVRPATDPGATAEQQLLLILLNASAQHTGVFALAG
ncbi:hypothetical protein [Hymenobacter persicinus]|uniref:Uncharacterized protein n=1 Tax=Hymenobacter persicinus TaxID=2025506 RepID=A0A4Q5LHF8_9BACT|nr:hypothetical protein [Hymenobacter persicinus]RYU83779.1 hypothetical protein EWM57_02205 [Hymenobacter persicinus]